uniref:Uncharacterized protein n=1 Tax=viral metagenome TaxID=1070528 RepID=A0A6C0JN84_9ZZZZ
MVAKTLFTTNVPKVNVKNVYLAPTVTDVTTVPIVVNEDIYQTLSEFSITIQDLLYNFSLGNFAYVTSVLTNRYYRTLSIKISRIIYLDYPIYEQLRLSIKQSLQGLYKAIIQYSVLNETKIKLEAATEQVSILNDPERLKEYINGLRGSSYLLPDLIIKAPLAIIKQEYVEYIKAYGYPAGGIFDMDRLAEILIRLSYLS